MKRLLSLALVLTALSPALAQERPLQRWAALREKVDIDPEIEYARAGEIGLKLDVYKPKAASERPRPCVVWIHGGGWQSGNKSSGLVRLGELVASGDYVGVSVGYRLTDKASWPAQIHDCKAAIRWIRAHSNELGIDREKIGVFGSSAGGHLVSHLGTSGDVKEVEGELGTSGVSSRVACVVDFCGPSDFLLFGLNSPRMNQPGAPVYKLLGGPPREKSDAAKAASPVTHASADDPPFLIVHGTDDRTVPFSQSQRLHDALKEAGANSTLVKVIDGPHGLRGKQLDVRVRQFFDKHLLGKGIDISAEPIQAEMEPAAKKKAA